MVATFLNLPRGHTADVHLFYEVPLGGQQGYRLLIQKQAGSPGMPATITVSYPGGLRRSSGNLSVDLSMDFAW